MFEEDAKEYAEPYIGATIKSVNNSLDAIVFNTYLAGAFKGYNKANEWHDLRKNPNDLPTENMKQVVVKTDDNDYYMGWYCTHEGTWWCNECPDADDEITNVIKWKEIKED